MTQEEKVRKYEEVIERAKQWHNAPNIDKIPTYANRIIEELFPELKGSEDEDEKWRNWLIGHLKEYINQTNDKYAKVCKEAIAWLEKQCKQMPADNIEPKFKVNEWDANKRELKNIENMTADKTEAKFKVDDWVVNNTTLNSCHIVKVEHGQYICDDCSFPITEENKYHLWTIQDAKDGDVLVIVDNKNPFIYEGCLDPAHPKSPVAYCGINNEGHFQPRYRDNDWWTDNEVQPATKEQHELLFKKMKEAGYEWDVNKRELKMIENKTAKKFKVGDWIITTGKVVYQIKDDKNYLVTLIEPNGHQRVFNDSILDDSRLWTIKDAKDGDVLAFDDEIIVIFKNLYNTTSFHSYCYIEEGAFSVGQDDMPDWWNGNGFHPATNEQRELLFQKMKEAGYEWDADKKELNNILQKSTEWYEKTKGLNELETYILSIAPNRTLDAVKVDSKNIRFLINKEQKLWSEEDECYMNECIAGIATKDGWSFEEKRKTKHWLKSLKERIGG